MDKGWQNKKSTRGLHLQMVVVVSATNHSPRQNETWKWIHLSNSIRVWECDRGLMNHDCFILFILDYIYVVFFETLLCLSAMFCAFQPLICDVIFGGVSTTILNHQCSCGDCFDKVTGLPVYICALLLRRHFCRYTTDHVSHYISVSTWSVVSSSNCRYRHVIT